MSLWINQSEKKDRVNVLENVINRQGKKNRRRTVSTFIEKRDKPELEKILLYFIRRNFLSNNKVFVEDIQKVTDKIFQKFQKNFTAIQKNFKEEEW